jgi:hypothetical protein
MPNFPGFHQPGTGAYFRISSLPGGTGAYFRISSLPGRIGASGDTESAVSVKGTQIEAQRSGFDLERRSSGMSAL